MDFILNIKETRPIEAITQSINIFTYFYLQTLAFLTLCFLRLYGG